MKKNGYTLVELILTIGLLATASTIVLINMVGMKSSQDQERQDRFQKSIESAACAYVDTMMFSERSVNRDKIKSDCKVASDSSKSTCQIYLSELVDDELALVDTELKDPETNQTAYQERENIYVFVYFKNVGTNANPIYEKNCEFKRK